jgi:DNA-binding MarR family transcriptional regulator
MNIEDSIIPILGKTVKLLDFYVEDKLNQADIPLTKLQFVFLRIISLNNEQAQNNLADLVARDKTTFTRNINTLEKKGLVSRKPSTSDKRVKLVSITPLGTELLNKSLPILESIVKEVEEDISEQERQAFKSTLMKIRTKLTDLRTKNKDK